MKALEIMTTKVITVAEDTPVPQIASLLRDNRISGAPAPETGAQEGQVMAESKRRATAGGSSAPTSRMRCAGSPRHRRPLRPPQQGPPARRFRPSPHFLPPQAPGSGRCRCAPAGRGG